MDAMIEPKRAAVRPRIISPDTGEMLLLEDVLSPGFGLAVQGGPGMGKTMAVAHIRAVRPGAHVFEHRPDLEFLVRSVEMAPWGPDEILEYAMARHRDQLKPLMRRIQATADFASIDGVPELVVMAIDAMAADEAISDARTALLAAVRNALSNERARVRLARGALGLLTGFGKRFVLHARELAPRVLRHDMLVRMLAAERVARELRKGAPCPYFSSVFPVDLGLETARHVGRDPSVLAGLRGRLRDPAWKGQPAIASILHAAGCGWTPDQDGVWFLEQAHLPGVDLRRVRMPRLIAHDAVLSEALMTDACIESFGANRADLRRADLHCASFGEVGLHDAKLDDADLSFVRVKTTAGFHRAAAPRASFENALLRAAVFAEARLDGARFARADLRAAVFTRATLDGADFSGANLERADLRSLPLNRAIFHGARLTDACMLGADLEGLDCPGAQMAGAILNGADLTDACLLRANLEGAALCRTRLAGVDLSGANLRDADLTGVSFHLGTSRSGMLFKGPSEGTRTGFYTDEYHEQSCKRPEEIRVANLRGADLRGAHIGNVDFYLVDLRDALYTPEQEAHFRKCRAILNAPVR